MSSIEVNLLDWWPKKGDKAVAEAAWASTYDTEKVKEKTAGEVQRVCEFLVQHKHDTPKETVWTSWWLKVPIFVERQLDKYRMTQQEQDFQVEFYRGEMGRWNLTQNELSGRYRTMPEEFYECPADIKQILGECNQPNLVDQYNYEMRKQHRVYREWLAMLPPEWRKRDSKHNWKYKRVREVFRGLLGTGTFTQMRLVANLKALEHLIGQRLKADAQAESQQVARMLVEELRKNKVAEAVVEAMLEHNGWGEYII